MNQRLEGKYLFWHIVFYFSLFIISVWVILKSVGIIQTPFWLEYGVPMGGLVLGLLAFHNNIFSALKDLTVGQAILSTKVTHLETKVNHLDEDVEYLKNDFTIIKTDVGILKNDTHMLKRDMAKVKGKLSIA